MIRVEARYFATLRVDGKKKEILELQDGSVVADLLERVGVDIEDVAILLVNGHREEPDRELKEGDIVSLFPPVGGG